MSCTSANTYFAPYIAHLRADRNNALLVTIVTMHAPDMLCTYIYGGITGFTDDGGLQGGGIQFFSDRTNRQAGSSPGQGFTGNHPFDASQTDNVRLVIYPPRVVHQTLYLPPPYDRVELEWDQEMPGSIILILRSWGNESRSFHIDECGGPFLTAHFGTDTGLMLSLKTATQAQLDAGLG